MQFIVTKIANGWLVAEVDKPTHYAKDLDGIFAFMERTHEESKKGQQDQKAQPSGPAQQEGAQPV